MGEPCDGSELCACRCLVLLPGIDTILAGRRLFVKCVSSVPVLWGKLIPTHSYHLDRLWGTLTSGLWSTGCIITATDLWWETQVILFCCTCCNCYMAASWNSSWHLPRQTWNPAGLLFVCCCGWVLPFYPFTRRSHTYSQVWQSPVFTSSLKSVTKVLFFRAKACLAHMWDSCGRGRWIYRSKITL